MVSIYANDIMNEVYTASEIISCCSPDALSVLPIFYFCHYGFFFNSQFLKMSKWTYGLSVWPFVMGATVGTLSGTYIGRGSVLLDTELAPGKSYGVNVRKLF